MKLKKSALFSCIASFALLTTACSTTQEKNVTSTPEKPKNIIMVVADGMGPAYTTAYRLYKDDPSTPLIEPTVLDEYLVGTARTYPASVSGYVTDSAASATALAAGVKTYNGAIGIDVDKNELETVLHRAKKLGKETGLAVTSQIVHATPASYVAHNESRRNYDAIADSFLDNRIGDEMVVDVMLGGGWDYFIREDRNLVNEFIGQGYQYAESYTELVSLPKGKPTLGLFANTGLPKAMDDTNRNRLSMMTEAAIAHLENPNGFFLLVEASQVDWAGHANDIGSAMYEMEDLGQTMLLLKQYVAKNPDTLVVLTADHSTGGLTIGAKGDYRWSPKWIQNMKSSVTAISVAMLEVEDRTAYIEQEFGFKLGSRDKKLLATISDDMDQRSREAVLKQIIDLKTNTGWTTSGHTGVDVEVYAFGVGSEAFAGNLNNIDIANNIFSLLGEVEPTE